MKLFCRYFAKLDARKGFEPIYTVLVQEYSDDCAALTDIYAISAHLKTRLHTVSKLDFSRSSYELETIFREHFNYKYVLEDVSSQVIYQLAEQQNLGEHELYGHEVFHADLRELYKADGTFIDVSQLRVPKIKRFKPGL